MVKCFEKTDIVTIQTGAMEKMILQAMIYIANIDIEQTNASTAGACSDVDSTQNPSTQNTSLTGFRIRRQKSAFSTASFSSGGLNCK